MKETIKQPKREHTNPEAFNEFYKECNVFIELHCKYVDGKLKITSRVEGSDDGVRMLMTNFLEERNDIYTSMFQLPASTRLLRLRLSPEDVKNFVKGSINGFDGIISEYVKKNIERSKRDVFKSSNVDYTHQKLIICGIHNHNGDADDGRMKKMAINCKFDRNILETCLKYIVTIDEEFDTAISLAIDTLIIKSIYPKELQKDTGNVKDMIDKAASDAAKVFTDKLFKNNSKFRDIKSKFDKIMKKKDKPFLDTNGEGGKA